MASEALAAVPKAVKLARAVAVVIKRRFPIVVLQVCNTLI